MEITINDHRKIFAIQKEFSDMFPFLRLEFYSKPHKAGGSASEKLMKHISKSIAECRNSLNRWECKLSNIIGFFKPKDAFNGGHSNIFSNLQHILVHVVDIIHVCKDKCFCWIKSKCYYIFDISNGHFLGTFQR